MELTAVIEERGSARHYKPDTVPVEVLKELVRLAGLAPSVANAQPWRFVCITNKDLLKQMADAVHQKLHAMLPEQPGGEGAQPRNKVEWFSTFFADAPAVIAVLRSPYSSVVDEVLPTGLSHEQINQMRGYPDIQSIGAAVEHILLGAVDKGLGACWLSGPLVARQELEAILDIREPWSLAAMVAVGYPAGPARPQAKKPVDEIFELRS